MKAGSTMLKSV